MLRCATRLGLSLSILSMPSLVNWVRRIRQLHCVTLPPWSLRCTLIRLTRTLAQSLSNPRTSARETQVAGAALNSGRCQCPPEQRERVQHKRHRRVFWFQRQRECESTPCALFRQCRRSRNQTARPTTTFVACKPPAESIHVQQRGRCLRSIVSAVVTTANRLFEGYFTA